MKKPAILWLLFFLLPAFCFGQRDFCKKIKKTTENGFTTYKSPELKAISVIKQLKEATVFTLHIHFKDQIQHFETYGAEVEFEDGTILKDENVKVHCTQELSSINGMTSSSSTISGNYMLQGFFSITDENVTKFASQRIVRVQLHTAIRPISYKDGNAIMNYVICMYDLR